MYINDLPRATKFQTTLFADEPYFCLSDPDLLSLQNRVNTELKKSIIGFKVTNYC